MEQYLIYLRKSRSDLEAEAHGEGETLSRHEHTLLELAKRQHLNGPAGTTDGERDGRSAAYGRRACHG